MTLVIGPVSGQAATAAGQSTKVYALVELSQAPTTVVYSQRLPISGQVAASTESVSQLSVVEQEQASFEQTLASANLPETQEIYRLQRTFNGILYHTPASNLAALKALPGVKSVRLLTPRTLDNASSIPFIGVNQLWSLGVPLHGENIKVGVIDSGIDYTHANFGGPGTAADYFDNDPSVANSAFPTAKVVGGWDFAGSAYDAANDATAIPLPDPNPIDGDGHGSHVAGTIAGYGVNADGTTYTGTYDMSLDTTQMRIGPGAAPMAQLYALKVFGEPAGSTSLAALALEWATDPNGDGDFSDHLDVVNLSLGSSYGTASDPEAIIYTNAVRAGVVVVASAGNSSDVYFITGAPASTPEVISVAATESDRVPYAALGVNAPSTIAGAMIAGTAAAPAVRTPVTGDLVMASPADGCAALTGTYTGMMVLIDRGTCSFQTKIDNAAAAGALGVVIANSATGSWPITMAVSDTTTTPSRIITYDDGLILKTELAVPNTVNVTIDDSLFFFVNDETDQVASFTSRGPSRKGMQPLLKPDLAAPGVNIISTGMGSGDWFASMSGTSMASPLAAGVMTLLRQAHPTWTPAQLKALAMNTANHDLFTLAVDPTSKVNPGRVGAGRVDAAAALDDAVIAYDRDNPARVSVSFATVDVAAPVTEDRVIQLHNTGSTDVVFDASVAPVTEPAGASVTIVAPLGPITVPAGGNVDVTIQLAADPAAMTRAHDTSVPELDPVYGIYGYPRYWLSETTGYVVFAPQSGSTIALRVPYYAALNPSSDMHAAGPIATTDLAGTTQVDLVGQGIDTTGIDPAYGVFSLVTPFELLHVSAKDAPVGFSLPTDYDAAETDNANLQYVGVTSTLPDVGAVADSTLYFGLTTYGIWGSPREVEFDVYIKAAGAPDWQYVLYNSALNGDMMFSRLLDLTASTGLWEYFLNGLAQSEYYVPTFLSDAMVMGVDATDLGLTDGSAAIDFQIVSFSSGFSGPVDITPVLHYDLQKPALATNADSTILPAGYIPAWLDQDGQSIPVTYDLNNGRNGQVRGMLLIHHLNGASARGEVVPVDGMSCTSDTDCRGDAANPICDVASGICVGCVTTADCDVGSYCDVLGSRTCVACDGSAACTDCRAPGAAACADHTYCSATTGQCLPVASLVLTTPEPAGANCPAGGVRIDTGLDDNNDGVLDPAEVQSTSYVCSAVAQLVSVTPIDAGTTCPYGGQLIESGADVDGDGILDATEVTYSEAVCNGIDTLVAVSPEAAGTNCQYGGQRIDSGVDTNGNGILDVDEVSDTSYVCDGAPGADGLTSLVSVTEEPAGDNCAEGGQRIDSGLDTDRDGVLSADEITATSYVCNGITGAEGPQGPTGPQGPAGPSGCSAMGGDPSLLVLLGMAGLFIRRRRK